MNYRMQDIPVPQEVIDRQAAIRRARMLTAVMYGVNTKPQDFDTPEYLYFRSMMLNELKDTA